jgi:flavorubredoxin
MEVSSIVDVVIIYDSRSGHTEKAAGEIRSGVEESGASVEMKKVDDATVEDARKAKAVVLGSPCISDNYSGKLRIFVEEKLVQAKPSEKLGAAFGTYKWNGGNLKKLEDDMRWMGITLVADGVNAHHFGDDEANKKLKELGKKVGEAALKA